MLGAIIWIISRYNYHLYLHSARRAKIFYQNYHLSGGFVLDAGCGRGRIAAMLSNLGTDIVGLDKKGDGLWRKISAKFVIGDILNIPFENDVFDTCISFLVLEYVRDDEKAIMELYRVLKPSGKLLVSVANRNNLYSLRNKKKLDPAHEREYTAVEITNKLKDAGFELDAVWSEKISFPVLSRTLNVIIPECILIKLGNRISDDRRNIIYVRGHKPCPP